LAQVSWHIYREILQSSCLKDRLVVPGAERTTFEHQSALDTIVQWPRRRGGRKLTMRSAVGMTTKNTSQ